MNFVQIWSCCSPVCNGCCNANRVACDDNVIPATTDLGSIDPIGNEIVIAKPKMKKTSDGDRFRRFGVPRP